MNAYSNFIHNSTKLSINRLMKKEYTLAYSFTRRPLNHKKESITNQCKTWINSQNITMSKRIQTQKVYTT